MYPVLKVVEDDGVTFFVGPHVENERGKLEVSFARKVFSSVTLNLRSDDPSSGWHNWSVVFSAGECGSKIIDRGCDSGTTNIKVWASINVDQHTGVPEAIGYLDGNDTHVYVKCG